MLILHRERSWGSTVFQVKSGVRKYKEMMGKSESMRKKSRKNACESVTALVDETNNPGSRTDGKYYVFGATVINSDDVDDFGNIMNDGSGKERKFRKHKKLRECTLDRVNEYDPTIYAVSVVIPRRKRWNEKQQLNVHRNALNKMIDRIVKICPILNSGLNDFESPQPKKQTGHFRQ